MAINIWEFLTKSSIGLIIIAIISSIIGSLLYDYLKNTKRTIELWYKKRRFTKRLARIGNNFCWGYRFGSMEVASNYKQIAFIGSYLIEVLIHIGWIISLLLLCIVIILITQSLFWWISIIVFAVIITIRYKRLIEFTKAYNELFQKMLGEKYLNRESDSMVEYWDKVTNKKTHHTPSESPNEPNIKPVE